MRVAIVSDSHGHAAALAGALGVLSDQGCDAIVHCGDISNRSSVAALGAAAAETYLVAGNMDRRYHDLADDARRVGVHFSPRCIEVPLGGGEHMAVTHGHDGHLLDGLIAGGQFAYVCHGHTHRRRDERNGRVRIICPGALSHPRRPRRPGLAVLDVDADELTFIDLPRGH